MNNRSPPPPQMLTNSVRWLAEMIPLACTWELASPTSQGDWGAARSTPTGPSRTFSSPSPPPYGLGQAKPVEIRRRRGPWHPGVACPRAGDSSNGLTLRRSSARVARPGGGGRTAVVAAVRPCHRNPLLQGWDPSQIHGGGVVAVARAHARRWRPIWQQDQP